MNAHDILPGSMLKHRTKPFELALVLTTIFECKFEVVFIEPDKRGKQSMLANVAEKFYEIVS